MADQEWQADVLDDIVAADAQATEEPSEASLGELGILAGELTVLRDEIAQAEAGVKALKEKERELSEKRIPDMMLALRLKTVTTDTGKKLAIKEDVAGSLPKDFNQRTWALNFIREHGGEELIKHEVSASFGKGEEHAAKALLKLLQERGDKHKDEVGIHPQTLGAWVREKLKAGESLPLENLGMYQYRKTEIK
jgi:hypothetical protein